ncbi:MAG TPA: carboxylesterase family protein [Pseudonocardiaceae bacterium]|nr:carboxylesterase family protein [Pseudonocardiaceae bacterium]
MSDVVVQTKAGLVRGSGERVMRFLGIPYAAAPFGPNRFAAPAPVTPWEGVRDALEFGPTPPGAGLAPDSMMIYPDPIIPGEECLNLNVWTPDTDGQLPVLVWFAGGANVVGSSAQPVYDGTAFARDRVVLVSVNHRLGVEGFAHLPGAPANRATLDQLAALTWVRDNIAGFGGDPNAVTVAGVSAGAGAVLTLLSLDTGLFRGAIIQSGLLSVGQTPADAALVAANVARRAGVEPTADGLRAVDPDRLAAIALDVSTELEGSGQAFAPVIDGELISAQPLRRVLDGAGRNVDVLVGFTSDELLRLLHGRVPDDVDLATLGIDAGTAARYAEQRPGAPAIELYATILADRLFREPVYDFATRRPGTYVYEFAWRSTIPGVGAAHGLDVGFVFETLGHSSLEGDAPPQGLAAAMHRAWVTFARFGRPGWSAFPQLMRLDTKPRTETAR